MSTTIIGTSHFPTFDCAVEYYRAQDLTWEDVRDKVAAGEIHIGVPEHLKHGDKLILTDNHTRYAIVSRA